MSYGHFGILLRELRESRNLTREQLAYNICTPKQIYRIEKGEYEPSLYLLNKLSIKFNMDLNEYYKMYFSNRSILAFEGVEKINKAISSNDIKQVANLVNKYKDNKDFMEGENLQHIYYGQALCASLLEQNFHQSIEYCMKGIYIENPQFTIETIKDYTYSNVGITLINCISRNYFALNQAEIGIKILKDLLYVLDYYVFNSPYPINQSSDFTKKIYQTILYNLCLYLLDTDDKRSALSYANKGIEFSIKENNIRFLPDLLFIKFRLLYHLSNIPESKICYIQAKNLLEITGQNIKLQELEQTVIKEYPKLLEN